MNPGGPIEEAGATARSLIDGLKQQPVLLGLALLQFGMLIFIFYALTQAAGFRDKMLAQQFEFAHKVTELLSKCVVPDKSTYTSEPLKPIGEVKEPLKPAGD